MTYHVVPRGDLVEHTVTEVGECVCGPRDQSVVGDDGSTVWVTVHHSLDGREQKETQA